MRRFIRCWTKLSALLLASAIGVTPVLATGAQSEAPNWAPADAGVNESKYAPDRMVEIQKLALDVTPDFTKQTIKGSAVFSFKPIGKPLQQLRLDAVDLAVSELTSTAGVTAYDVTDKEIIVSFAKPIPVGTETKLTIQYSAKPLYGFYFRSPANGYPAEEVHAFSQGEMIESRHWFPCLDHPNSKFTSEITCHVPKDLVVISNGKEISRKNDPDGNVAVRWSQDKPHVNYLVTLVVGKFSKIEDNYRDVPLAFYTLPSDKQEAPAAFAPTKAAMAFFEKETGVDYPWAQYGQVVIRDYHYGGMENTSITTLGESVLYPPETENVYAWAGLFNADGAYMSEALVTHELAHQWFGDLVTCKDWSHAWLNEGFATYYSMLFAAHNHGDDDMIWALMQNADNALKWKDERPIVYRRFKEPVEQFSHNRAYAKASWVVHMLRRELGDELFRRCIKTYFDRFQFKTVVTEDLNNVVEELSGRSFDQFFDQWLYSATVPELNANYEWDEQEKIAKISVSQTQRVGERRLKMQFPLTLAFKTKDGTIERRVEVKDLDEDFYVPLEQAPYVVRIDPKLSLLAKITFRVPTRMLYSQLVEKSDTAGRILAAEQLGEKQDETTIAKLKSALNSDQFFGVRVKAAEALSKIHSDDALEALISSMKQSDARARLAVIKAIGDSFNKRAMDVLLKHVETETNPAIVGIALSGISVYTSPQVQETLLKYLDSKSYQNRLSVAAMRAIKNQPGTSFIKPLQELLRKRSSEFLPDTLGYGLGTLAALAKDEKQKEDVRIFITSFLDDKRTRAQSGAIQALGALGDPKSLPVLEPLVSSAKASPQQADAERAVEAIRGWNKPSDNLADLRNQVLELQKSQRELKKELDDLRKRIKAEGERKTTGKAAALNGKPDGNGKPNGNNKANANYKANANNQPKRTTMQRTTSTSKSAKMEGVSTRTPPENVKAK